MEFITKYFIDILISIILLIAPLIIINRYLFKVYFIIEKYKKKVLFGLFLIGFIIGTIVYLKIYGLEPYQAIYYGLIQFMFDIKTPSELGFISTINVTKDNPIQVSNFYYLIYISAFIAFLTSTLVFLTVFFNNAIHRLYASSIIKNNSHIIVFGLGEKATAYIESELDNHVNSNKSIIVIEKDVSNLNIKKYREKYYKQNFEIKIGDASDIALLEELNIAKSKHLVIVAGKDTENVEIALAVSDVLNKLKTKSKKIEYKDTYMHLEDRDLHKLYREGGLFDDRSLLHIKMFSIAQNSAKSLFLEHDIDGDSREYIDSDKSFGIVVVGNTKLALEVIGQACEIAHFPNENIMTIYCIDINIAKFRRLIYHRYPNIEDIFTINLEFEKLNFMSRKFYEKSFWKNNVTNIILCHNDAQINLDIASELADSTYLRDIKKGYMKTKIHIAIYENTKIANSINTNKEQFKYFDVFAETFKMASKDIIVDENMETIAKCIHSAYAEKYDPNQVFNNDEIEEKWFENKALTDRDSNRAQAYHLPIKIKALGLRIDRQTFKDIDILTDNRKILNSDYISLNKERKTIMQNNNPMSLDDEALEAKTKNYITIPNLTSKYKNKQDSYKMAEEFDYFPETLDTLFEKLIRSEKNRWNAHHYLRGWKLSYKKDKDIKTHDCLVPLLELPCSKELLSRMKWQSIKIKSILLDYNIYYAMVNNKRYTILYDIYSILYIPNFLAKINKKLKVYKRKKFGITGHRYLSQEKYIRKVSKIQNSLILEINKLDYVGSEIISPLAEGADRIVAKLLMDIFNMELTVPLPFQLNDYKEDFSEISNIEFDSLLHTASNIYEVSSLEVKIRDDAYFEVGKNVVDKCDILIALWDKKETKGIGGTGDVVKYAKEKNKPILHINTETLKVEWFFRENIDALKG